MRKLRQRIVRTAAPQWLSLRRLVLAVVASVTLVTPTLARAVEPAAADAANLAIGDGPIVRLPPVSHDDRSRKKTFADRNVRPTAHAPRPRPIAPTLAPRSEADQPVPSSAAPARFIHEIQATEIEEVVPRTGGADLPVDLVQMPAHAFPIDLATTLRLAGANNLQIALARAGVDEAQAVLLQANVLWVPSLQAGVGYNRHDGPLQDTRGDVLNVNRSSLFAGGGAITSSFPLTGGTNGPARFAADLSLSDALFEPLASRQSVRARQSNVRAMFNDALLSAATAYLALGEAYVALGIAEEATANATELVRITAEFARAGRGLEADAQRARTALADRQRQFFQARERVGVVSAELVRQLRLDPTVILWPLEAPVGPLDLVDIDQPLGDLISQALAARPELRRQQAVAQEAYARARQEQWRPWLPNLYAGTSGGGFGGGPNGFLGDFDGRIDVDALAVWELQNLGLGTRALRAQAFSRNEQARIQLAQTRDLVAAEVARALREAEARRGQLDRAHDQLEAASRALPLNVEGILGGVLRPIETQQAIDALATAQTAYASALVGYNQAQFALLRAIGVSPEPQQVDMLLQQ